MVKAKNKRMDEFYVLMEGLVDQKMRLIEDSLKRTITKMSEEYVAKAVQAAIKGSSKSILQNDSDSVANNMGLNDEQIISSLISKLSRFARF